MTDTPNTQLDLDAIEARHAYVEDQHRNLPGSFRWQKTFLEAHLDRSALTAEVRKLRETLKSYANGNPSPQMAQDAIKGTQP